MSFDVRAISTRLLQISFAVLIMACRTDREPAKVTQWRGLDLHGELRGEIQGERVDVLAEGDEVVCKRKYVVPEADDSTTFVNGRLAALLIGFLVTVDGVERTYEIEMYDADFAAAAPGSVLKVSPKQSAIGADGVHVELRWEWELGNDLIAFDRTATSGTVELRELSGSPGPDGLVIPANEGLIGAFLDLQLPGGSVTASFTAPCTAVAVESL